MNLDEITNIIFGISEPPSGDINITLDKEYYQIIDPYKSTVYSGVKPETLARLVKRKCRLNGINSKIYLNGNFVTSEDVFSYDVVPVSYMKDEAFYKFHLSKAFCDMLVKVAQSPAVIKSRYKFNFFSAIMINLFQRNFFPQNDEYRYAAMLPKGKGIYWYYNADRNTDEGFLSFKNNPNQFIKDFVPSVLAPYQMYFSIDDNSPHIILFKVLLAISAFTLGSIIDIEAFIFHTPFSYLKDLDSGKQYEYCIQTYIGTDSRLYPKSGISKEESVYIPIVNQPCFDTEKVSYLLLSNIQIADICKVVQCICPFIYEHNADNILNFYLNLFAEHSIYNIDMFAPGSNEFLGCALSCERNISEKNTKTGDVFRNQRQFTVTSALKYFSSATLQVNDYSVKYYNLYELIENTYAENIEHVGMCNVSLPLSELTLQQLKDMHKYFLSPDMVGQLLTATFYNSAEVTNSLIPYPANTSLPEDKYKNDLSTKDKYLSIICKMLSKQHYKFKECCTVSDLKFILDFRPGDDDTLDTLNLIYNQLTIYFKYVASGKIIEYNEKVRSKLTDLLSRVWVGVAPSEKISNGNNIQFIHTPFCPGYPDLKKTTHNLDLIIPLLSVKESIEVQKHPDYLRCVGNLNTGIFISPEYILPLIEKDNLYTVGVLPKANLRYIKTEYSSFREMSPQKKLEWITSGYSDINYSNPYNV